MNNVNVSSKNYYSAQPNTPHHPMVNFVSLRLGGSKVAKGFLYTLPGEISRQQIKKIAKRALAKYGLNFKGIEVTRQAVDFSPSTVDEVEAIIAHLAH